MRVVMSQGDTTSGHRYQRPGSEWPHDGRAAFGSVASGFVRNLDNMVGSVLDGQRWPRIHL
jgi:hypothetical protein